MRLSHFFFSVVCLLAVTVFTAGEKTAAAQALAPPAQMVSVKYLGHKSYPWFTRLVFDTGGVKAASFKVNYDEGGGRVVFYPEDGLLAFSFAPVSTVDELVRQIDFVENEDLKRGIVVRLGQLAGGGIKVSRLSEPESLVIDIYKKTAPPPYLPFGRPVKTIALDPGHGGKAPCGAQDTSSEGEFALDMALRLRKLLTARGFVAALTRESDTVVPQQQRAGMANSARADLFLSIHATGSFDKVGRGVGVYTADAGRLGGGTAQSPLAWEIQQAAYLPDSLRLAGELAGTLGKIYGADAIIGQTRLAGFEGLAMPAALVELGTLSDPAQAESMAEDNFRSSLAEKLARGIEAYAKGVGR